MIVDVATIGSGVLPVIYELAVLIPSLAVAVRRPPSARHGPLRRVAGEQVRREPEAGPGRGLITLAHTTAARPLLG
ncbi:hypothetical protein, partial [Streptomyces sp. NPDC057412]|uniref:hypothetical protein n=1 Tax=Streptomyces sp. NPDC057412 TaxID=3346123 RepID=UPI0036B7F003